MENVILNHHAKYVSNIAIIFEKLWIIHGLPKILFLILPQVLTISIIWNEDFDPKNRTFWVFGGGGKEKW
ncbi:transmembrane protein, putative [Medicago truncatula]|uniref:Transmembrane protein, putative n=1 Tax=Medicago truncatula TaxID=3880 RepID=G7K6Y5_MEDTR|nr:transmembrane protein, putative [Medicago truncatula]